MRALLAVGIVLSVARVVAAQTGSNPEEAARRDPRPPVAPGAAAQVVREAGSILASQCVGCHGPGKKKGGLDLTRRAPALAGGDSGAVIVPGQPGESLLVERVAEGEMPPKGALSKNQVEALRA